MIVERNIELAEALGSRKTVVSYVVKMLCELLLVAVCLAILLVLVVGVLEGAELGA